MNKELKTKIEAKAEELENKGFMPQYISGYITCLEEVILHPAEYLEQQPVSAARWIAPHYEEAVNKEINEMKDMPEQIKDLFKLFVPIAKSVFEIGVDRGAKIQQPVSALWVKASLDNLPKITYPFCIKYNNGLDREIGSSLLIKELIENGWEDVYYLDESPKPLTDEDIVAGGGNTELFKNMWYSRNPIHENNADSGEDMFWETAEMVAREYVHKLNAHKATQQPSNNQSIK